MSELSGGLRERGGDKAKVGITCGFGDDGICFLEGVESLCLYRDNSLPFKSWSCGSKPQPGSKALIQLTAHYRMTLLGALQAVVWPRAVAVLKLVSLEDSPLLSPGEKELSLRVKMAKIPAVFLLTHHISREEMTLAGELCVFTPK